MGVQEEDPNKHAQMSVTETSQRYYEAMRDHLLAALLSAHEQYDKAILTLSTGLLGLSVTFLKPISVPGSSKESCLLTVSWVVLLLAVASTVISFVASQRATRRALDDAYDIYILRKPEAISRSNQWTTATEFLNICSGVLFLLGVALTVLFVILHHT